MSLQLLLIALTVVATLPAGHASMQLDIYNNTAWIGAPLISTIEPTLDVAVKTAGPTVQSI
jgi:hypothetical protein